MVFCSITLHILLCGINSLRLYIAVSLLDLCHNLYPECIIMFCTVKLRVLIDSNLLYVFVQLFLSVCRDRGNIDFVNNCYIDKVGAQNLQII